jgi:hypothetical protein
MWRYNLSQAAEREILWGISDSTGSRNINIVGVYLIGQATEIMGYSKSFFDLIFPAVLQH